MTWTKQTYSDSALMKRGAGRARELPRRLKISPEEMRNKRVLEVGCGFGEHICHVKDQYDCEVIGIDPWPRFKEGPFSDREYLREGDILSPDILNLGKFDYIASYDVLEHVEIPEMAVKNISSLLKPGGRAFLKFNLHRGASASHVVHLTEFPWCHLILTPSEIEDLVFHKHGYRRGPSWVNYATYAHYIEWFSKHGLLAEAIWYDRFRISDEFYQMHYSALKGYPRYELERNFMMATLSKPV